MSNLCQANLSISAYFTKCEQLWDEYIILVAPCAYASTSLAMKLIERLHLMQFLMGLNDSYQVVRSNILMLNPLPTVSQASSKVLQEEQQREIRTIAPTPITDSSAFLSPQKPCHSNRPLTQPSVPSSYGQQQHNPPIQSQPYHTGSKKPLIIVQCNNCRRPRHTMTNVLTYKG